MGFTTPHRANSTRAGGQQQRELIVTSQNVPLNSSLSLSFTHVVTPSLGIPSLTCPFSPGFFFHCSLSFSSCSFILSIFFSGLLSANVSPNTDEIDILVFPSLTCLFLHHLTSLSRQAAGRPLQKLLDLLDSAPSRGGDCASGEGIVMRTYEETHWRSLEPIVFLNGHFWRTWWSCMEGPSDLLRS